MDETANETGETSETGEASHRYRPAMRRWVLYALKAAILLGVLFVFARYAACVPTFLVGLLWVVLSTISMVGVLYHDVIRKIRKQVELESGGLLAKVNNGRKFCSIAAFVLSAICMGGLLFNAPTWETTQWIVVVIVAALFPLIVTCVDRFLRGEVKEAFRVSRTVMWSSVIAAVLLCAAYGVLVATQPVTTYADATEAFLATPNYFEDSPSAIMEQGGIVLALSDGLMAYARSKVADVSYPAYLAFEIFLTVSSFSGLASLLGTCSLTLSELKSAFMPLPSVSVGSPSGVATSSDSPRPVRHAVIIAICMPALCLTAFLVGDHLLAKAVASDEYTCIERIARDQVGVATYVLDGKYYDQKAVEDLAASTRDKWATLSSDAQTNIVPLINASFDQREANVDSYLDWYYSLAADYERLAGLVSSSVEDYVEGQFEEKIEAGIDDTELESRFNEYIAQAGQLESDYQEGLASYELDGLPGYLMVSNESIDAVALEDPVREAQETVDAAGRAGFAGVGVAGGGIAGKAAGEAAEQAAKEAAEQGAKEAAGEAVGEAAEQGAKKAAGEVAEEVAEQGAKEATGEAAQKVVTRVAEKQFFKKVATKLTEILGTRAAGTAIGGGVGTVAGPGVGTALGIAAGTAIGVGVDYGLLKIDEAQNRDEYQQQIVDAIEEERSEWLAIVSAAPEAEE